MAASAKELCHKLAELGWLFYKVNLYVESRSRDKAFGLVGQVSSCLVTVTIIVTSLVGFLCCSW